MFNILVRMRTLIRQEALIRWKLREVMARKRFSIRGLAEAAGLSRGTVTTLREADTLPGMGEGTLEKLCTALDCSPLDLIEYVRESDRKDD